MYSYRFASIKESFHAGAEGPSPSPDDRWPSVVETLNPANAHTLISTPIRYVSQRVPSRWIIKPTGTGRPTNRSSITPVPPHSIFFFEDPSDSFGQYPGLILFMDIVDLVRHDKVTFARFQGWHIAHPTLVRMTGELVLEAALVDVPVTAVDHTTLRAMSRLPFTFLRGLVRAHFHLEHEILRHAYEQPHLRNFVTHSGCPILERRVLARDTVLIIQPHLSASSVNAMHVHLAEPASDEESCDESITISSLFYHDTDTDTNPLQPPRLSQQIYEPARPETSLGVVSVDEVMSTASQGTASTLLSPALSESDTLRSGISEIEVYILPQSGQHIELDDADSWTDDLSDIVFQTGENQNVVAMQPHYEEDNYRWLLNIMLDNDVADANN